MSARTIRANPVAAVPALWQHRALIRQLIEREIVGRYRGSVLGVFWSLVTPLIMLAIYTFVFGVVFQARWGEHGTSTAEFAVVLFAGLLPYSFFAEVVNRAPTLILSNAIYVKKVLFPLEILPIVAVGAGLFHACVGFAVLLTFVLPVMGHIPPTALLLPVVLLPLAIVALGLAWFLAALGVYLRDIPQIVAPMVTALLFLSPIFFPISALPPAIVPFIVFNPLSVPIEETRNVLIWGRMPDWTALAVYTALALTLAAGGFAWFQKTRKGFADVL